MVREYKKPRQKRETKLMSQLTEFERLVKGFDFSNSMNTPKDHLLALYMSVKGSRAKSILEIGSHKGYSAAVMLLAAKFYVTSITLVDSSHEHYEDRLHLLDTTANDNQIKCLIEHIDSTAQDFLKKANENRRTFDFIYHDAQHGIEMIPEYLAYWEILRPDGILAIHDYEMIPDGVMKEAGDKFYPKFFNTKASKFKTDAKGKKIAFFMK